MLDNYKIGNQLTLLRKEKGFTGEKLAELLGVSSQAVSKWENGKNLPETSLLQLISKILGVSIDSLLMPKELLILSAVYTDGLDQIDVTQITENLVHDNKLYLICTAQFFGLSPLSNRVGVLKVKYQTPEGIYYDFAVQGSELIIDLSTKKHMVHAPFEIIGAFYGNTNTFKNVMVKMQHYEYFHRNEIHVDQESFPSSPCTDEAEYLTLIYLNNLGIHAVSCEEGESLVYSSDKTSLSLKDISTCILPDIMTLEWEKDMDCTWVGAVYAALKYMGEEHTYEEIMGMSGACYRIAFTEIWDWSATDALVAFDYSSILFRAIGYEQIWADRVDKDNRYEERENIVSDISNGKPVIAINLRIAPEWGVITGYSENGRNFYCRTYFDKEYLNENNDYLETDNWPFMIVHFGDKINRPQDDDIMYLSLKACIDSFEAQCNRGYWQGRQAYEKWIEGLLNEKLWDSNNSKGDIERRLGVNDSTLLNLIDARRCAAVYLNECIPLLTRAKAELLTEVVSSLKNITANLSSFRNKLKTMDGEDLHYNVIDTKADCSFSLRMEQVSLLEAIVKIEQEIVNKVKIILEGKEEL